MNWLEVKTSILLHRSIDPATRLGAGEEAEVYPLGSEQVIRLFRRPPDPIAFDQRRSFYASLDAAQVSFAVPQVLEQHEEHGLFYAIETRIGGSSLMDLLPWLEGGARHDALLAYAETALEIGKLGTGRQSFGEVLAMSPIRADTWTEFVMRRAQACLAENHQRLGSLVDKPDRALARLQSMLGELPNVEPRLVHGDYHLANVMIDRLGRITGVIDFGGLTLIGDARMDAASALLYLIGLESISERDRQVVHACLRASGLRDSDVALYRLFYAFRFLDTGRDGLRRWCMETIRQAC